MLPETTTAPAPGADLAAYLRSAEGEVEKVLQASGAVLFRGFAVASAADFQRVVTAMSPVLLPYTYRSTPRTEEATGVYTSTEYPPDQEIPMHNENSYAHAWPLKLWFFCPQPARAGGATPLADSRRVAERLDPVLVQRFADRGVQYIRNYRAGMDLPWQEVFQTSNRGQVEQFCRGAGIEFEWHGDELRTCQTLPATARHPVTGETVWFNQAHLFHPSALDEDSRAALLALFGEAGLPRDARYGDSSLIAEEDLAAIRAAYQDEMVDVNWQQGDVLLIDNMLAAHGRRPYTPPRKVLVAMTDVMEAPAATERPLPDPER
jgi:alpha-ketoglutarate-dependent taurine dioxygenase